MRRGGLLVSLPPMAGLRRIATAYARHPEPQTRYLLPWRGGSGLFQASNVSRDRPAALASASRRDAPSGPSSAASAALPMAGILALFFATKLASSLRNLREAA